MKRMLLVPLALLLVVGLCRADELDDLARDFWAWRAAEQPLSGDDIPRLDRPDGWAPDWSPPAVKGYRQRLAEFERRWHAIDATGWPVPRQVDYRLLGSAISRVRWELDLLKAWQRDPQFYVDQSLGAVFEQLRVPPPFTARRTRALILALQSIPKTCQDAEANLSEPPAAFARLAVASLADVRKRLLTSIRLVKPLLAPDATSRLDVAADRAATALESYRAWIEQRLPEMRAETAVGREAYLFFLRRAALVPYTPEQLLAMSRQEWARSVAFQTFQQHADLGLPELKLFPDQKAQMAAEARDELAVRRFLVVKHILNVPAWVRHYHNAPLPDYLAPVEMGVTDDLTGPSRLDQDATSYIRPPSPDLGYFALASAHDPRPILVHEGAPGHYFQLALSWANPDPIRRHYYDSGANEGIGFYAEEMMLEAGFFDDSPRVREIIYNFARLRALRVEVDVKLALGLFTLDQAADYLRATVPMDAKTAREEASSFAAGPGQAISYQVGKIQITNFLADARRQLGGKFDLEAFHDFVWQNGNVPIALQRWEYLGLGDDVDALGK